MLSSVPITIGGNKYSLQFTPLDIDLIEQDRDSMISRLLAEDKILRIGTLGAFLQYGLKMPGQFGSHGEPIRALPQTPEGREQALELVRQYAEGRKVTALTELAKTIYKALGEAEWFNLKKVSETITSVPQAVDPPKNSDEPGSSPSNQ